MKPEFDAGSTALTHEVKGEVNDGVKREVNDGKKTLKKTITCTGLF